MGIGIVEAEYVTTRRQQDTQRAKSKTNPKKVTEWVVCEREGGRVWVWKRSEVKWHWNEINAWGRHEFDVSDSNVRNGVANCRVAAAAVYCSSLKPPCTNNLCVLFGILSLSSVK